MLLLKPIFRTIVLSIILASLVIYLGIKYHWSDYLKEYKSNNISSLKIPPQTNIINQNTIDENKNFGQEEIFTPDIMPVKQQDNLISSMNKDQVTYHCKSLLSKTIQNTDQLSLAMVNCIVSNYQETLQTINDSSYLQKKQMIHKGCQKQFSHDRRYSSIEKQLLVGICTSDRLSQ